LAQFLQARVSIERIAAFFAEDEVDDEVSSLKMKPYVITTVPDATLGIVGNASFAWNSISPSNSTKRSPEGNGTAQTTAAQDDAHQGQGRNSPDSDSTSEEPRFELQDIDITFPEGRLTLVTGPTASGKTALLLAQLGEMTMLNASEGPSTSEGPNILLPKYPYAPPDQYGYRACVSYAAQAPWLEHLTIRDNILFGEPFESERYWTVIESCALKADLEMLEDGDLTEIGERGISLSGGQKARVALARAVYARSKIVLLDDPLSAVVRRLTPKIYGTEYDLSSRTAILLGSFTNDCFEAHCSAIVQL
jgi:ABC-type multidrug transport system fused ATPase/permease subunit